MRNHASHREGAILKGIRPFFIQINPINPLVWRAITNNGEAVFLKAAPRKETVLKQIKISSVASSFVSYLPFSDGEWIKESGGLTFACMKTIEGRALNYALKEDRHLAVEKIAHFHEEVQGTSCDDIPTLALIPKWRNRFVRFKQDIEGNVYPPQQEKLIHFYLSIGEHVVSQMKEVARLEETALRYRYIVHGDPAHHNFIFSRNQLRLIDGDLISYAPREYDYLQLLNRMLPHCNWSLDEWQESYIYPLRQCIETPYLRKLLAYPADFYREWLVNPSGRNELLVKTEEHHSKRAEFVHTVL